MKGRRLASKREFDKIEYVKDNVSVYTFQKEKREWVRRVEGCGRGGEVRKAGKEDPKK